jgi:hypothetical protein
VTPSIWLATILAWFVCFWVQLEAPTTPWNFAGPTRHPALDEAGFRLPPNVVGVTASIAIAGLFSQARDLILAAFAV